MTIQCIPRSACKSMIWSQASGSVIHVRETSVEVVRAWHLDEVFEKINARCTT